VGGVGSKNFNLFTDEDKNSYNVISTTGHKIKKIAPPEEPPGKGYYFMLVAYGTANAHIGYRYLSGGYTVKAAFDPNATAQEYSDWSEVRVKYSKDGWVLTTANKFYPVS
jgi:hypothetical protein